MTSLLAPALTAVGLGASVRLDWTISNAGNATGWEYRQAEPKGGLTAFPADKSVDLLWATPASTTGIAKWQYRHKSGGSDFPATWTDVTGSSAATTSVTVGSLTNSTAYTFQVRAVNSSDALVGTALGDAAATPSATPWTSVTGAATRTATVTGLTAATRYAFQVRAVNSIGPGPVSNVAATYAAARPAKPTGLSATSNEHKQSTIAWPTANTASTWQLRARQQAPGGMVIGSGLPERVTLSWDPVSRRGSWRYRQGTVSGGVTTWGEWTYLSCGAPCGSATLTLTLANDTLYTYQVRNTEQGVATMMTNLRASQHPRNLVFGTGEAQDVVLDWTNPGSSGTTKWQYRKGAVSGSTTTWDAAWTDIPCTGDCSPLTMSSHTITTSSSVLTTGSVHVYQVRSEGSSNNYHYPSDLSVWHTFGTPPTEGTNHTYAVTGLTNGLAHTFELRGLNAHDEAGRGVGRRDGDAARARAHGPGRNRGRRHPHRVVDRPQQQRHHPLRVPVDDDGRDRRPHHPVEHGARQRRDDHVAHPDQARQQRVLRLPPARRQRPEHQHGGQGDRDHAGEAARHPGPLRPLRQRRPDQAELGRTHRHEHHQAAGVHRRVLRRRAARGTTSSSG